MASVSAIRDGLKTRLQTISGLRVHDTAPSAISPPAAVIVPQTVDYDSTMARGSDAFAFDVFLLVSKAVDRVSQDKLDAYLAGSGVDSVKAAVEGDQSLGGVAHIARVAQARDYGAVEYGGISYLGAIFRVEVTAGGA